MDRTGHIGQPGPLHDFYHLVWSYTVTGALMAANRLGVFTALASGPASGAEVAARCGTRPDWTEKLLVACLALGLVDRRDGRYRNTPFADRYLVQGRPEYQGEIIEHQARWERWQELDYYIRTGQRGPREARDKAEMSESDRAEAHRTWILAMHNIAMAGQAEALANALDVSGRRLLFDVGGGPGTYAAVLCQRHPELRAVVLDLPETMPIAREVVARFNLLDRIELRAGDYLKDGYGEGNDVVLLSGVLHGETPDDCRLMLRKAHESLKPGGLVAVQEILINDDRTGPLLPALFSLHMTFGAAYTGREIADWLQASGFVDVQVRPLAGYSWLNALIVGVKPT
ncbi:MAG: methyltransferase [Bacillota bacterium]